MTKVNKNALQAAIDELVKAQKNYDKNKTAKNLEAKRAAARKVEDLRMGRPVKEGE